MPDKAEKNFNKEFLEIIEKCSDNLSFEDISRLNGIRIELLRRYIDRQAKNIRNETWDKIYPLLRPYLEGPEPIKEPPPGLLLKNLSLASFFQIQAWYLQRLTFFRCLTGTWHY